MIALFHYYQNFEKFIKGGCISDYPLPNSQKFEIPSPIRFKTLYLKWLP